MNQIYTHPCQQEMQAEIILASQGPDQKPIYTIRLRYPRIIHSELLTHRVFSRNARSSRAVPVKTMLNEVRNTPFVPWHWGKNQKGMQAEIECNEVVRVKSVAYSNGSLSSYDSWPLSRDAAWLAAAEKSAEVAEAFMKAGYHKQLANRLLEPFSWIDTLVTATEWDNFLWLRDHSDAEPHLQDLARLVKVAIENAKVWDLEPGEWHLPYITSEDIQKTDFTDVPEAGYEWLCKISAARCARISYKPFDGDASYERELERYNSLVTADRVHASPLEHQATPDDFTFGYEGQFGETLTNVWSNPELHGNLDGYIQYRKTIPNEAKMESVIS